MTPGSGLIRQCICQKACNLEDVMKVKEVVSIPVACAGRFDDPALADQVIAEGKLDIMGMGRPLLADPYAPVKFSQGRLDDVRPCIYCHQGCLGRIFQFKDISCAVNPACGREKSYALTPARQRKNLSRWRRAWWDGSGSRCGDSRTRR